MNKENLLNYLINGADVYTIENIIFNLSVTTLLGIYIFFVYKKTFRNLVYSQNFNVTIIMITVITGIVMMLIGSNLAISLGMVGALSIIRFRTAIKEPRDIGFLFWGIAVGLSAGTGEFVIAIVGSVFVTLVLVIFSNINASDNSYLLIIKSDRQNMDSIQYALKKNNIKYKLQMRNTSMEYNEVTYKVFLRKISVDVLVNGLKQIEGVNELHIVSYNGEVKG